MKKKVVLLVALTSVGTLMGGCFTTLHGLLIHGTEIIQTAGALNQLGL